MEEKNNTEKWRELVSTLWARGALAAIEVIETCLGEGDTPEQAIVKARVGVGKTLGKSDVE